MKILSFLIGLLGVSATNTTTPSMTRRMSVYSSPNATTTRRLSVSSTDTASFTHTGTTSRSARVSNTASWTNSGSGTSTQSHGSSSTPTGSLTATTTPLSTPPSYNQQQQVEAPNITYIAIGSVMGCLVLMTLVVFGILMNNRPNKKPMRQFSPTMINVPAADLGSMNPLSSRVLYSPQTVRGLTTMTD